MLKLNNISYKKNRIRKIGLEWLVKIFYNKNFILIDKFIRLNLISIKNCLCNIKSHNLIIN